METSAQRVVARFKLAQDDDDLKDTKKGEWNLFIRKYSATRWQYTLVNPHGGSGGSGAYPNQKAAIAAALGRGVNDTMGKDKVWVVIQEWDPDAGPDGDYKTKKTYWEDLKKGERSK